MNRITAVLLAMAALLVHVLVVHRDNLGSLTYAYECAHVAFELGVHLADRGEALWAFGEGGAAASATGSGGLASYPSPLLVWIAASAELLSLNVDRAAQVLGVLCALATVFLSTRFDTDRIAGVIPALLLVSSGAIAAAGASGTEWPIAMFALAMSFVSLEKSRSRFAALGLMLLVLARPEGIVCAAFLGLQTLARYARKTPVDLRPSLLVFLPAVGAVWIAHAAGSSLIPGLLRLFEWGDARTGHGIAQLRDFVLSTATPLLLIFPLVGLLRGGLTSTGQRAFFLTLVWCTATVGSGGGPGAFDIAFTPALPIAFIAIQQGMARVLDTYRKNMERLVWASLAVAILGSLFASRFPGDLGPLKIGEAQQKAFVASAAPSFGRGNIIGRASLFSEIQLVSNLRGIGSLLGARLPKSASILSPWPGVLSHYSGLRVIDAFGRTAALPGQERSDWTPEPGMIDIRSALKSKPDFILPSIAGLEAYAAGELKDLLPDGLFTLDPSDGKELRHFVGATLAGYELVVTKGWLDRAGDNGEPLLLLRRRGLERPMILRAEYQKQAKGAGLIRIEAGYAKEAMSLQKKTPDDAPGSTLHSATPPARASLPQVFDVCLEVVFEDGDRVSLDPVGRALKSMTEGGEELDPSLVGIVIDPRWKRPSTFAMVDRRIISELTSPSGAKAVRLEGRLLHHRIDRADSLANAAAPLLLPLR